MTELNYLDITKASDGHIKVPSIGLTSPAITESIAKTALASFADGAGGFPFRVLKGYINPVQNLNGQSAPYPAGGGDNKFNIADCTAKVAAFGLSHAIDGEYVRIYGTCSSGGTHGWKFVDVGAAMQTIGSTLSYKAFIVLGSPSITINSITYNSDNTLSINVGGLVTNQAYDFKIGVVGYTGTAPAAWSPYSNICPITGGTGMNVTRTGKNLINFPDCESTKTTAINTQYNTPYWDKLNYNYPFKENTQYTFSCQFSTTDTTSSWGLRVEYTNGTVAYLWLHRNTTDTNSITTAADRTIKRILFTYSASFNLAFSNAQLEEGTTATTFERSGATYPISWSDEAGTVYGGYLDVLSGLLTVTHELKAISELSWTQHPTNTIVFYTTVSGKAYGVSNIMSDAFSVTGDSVTSMTAGTMRGLANNAVVYIAANSTDATDFVNDYGTNQLLYELATPQTYQLTPAEVTSLLGANNVWVDTNGDVELTYIADTKLYIDKVIAEL